MAAQTLAPPPVQQAYTIDDVVGVTRLSRTTLYKLMSSGALPYVTIAGRRRIRGEDLRRLIEEGTPEE